MPSSFLNYNKEQNQYVRTVALVDITDPSKLNKTERAKWEKK